MRQQSTIARKTKLLTCLNYQYLLCINRIIRQTLSVNKTNVSVLIRYIISEVN